MSERPGQLEVRDDSGTLKGYATVLEVPGAEVVNGRARFGLVASLTHAAATALTATTGALRHITDKLRGLYFKAASSGLWVSVTGVANVQHFGAVGDGVANDTAAIQAAIDAVAALGGGVVFFPAGTFKYTSLTVASNYVRLKGTGRASRLACSSATGNGLAFDNGLSGSALNTYLYGCGAENVRFEPTVTRTSGYEIYAPHFSGLHLDKLSMFSIYSGILIGRAADLNVDAHISNLRIYGVHVGVKCVNALDMIGKGWVLDNANTTAGSKAVHLSGGCEGANVTNFDFVNSSTTPGAGSTSLHIKNTDGVASPARFNRFVAGYFDGGAYGALLEDGEDTELIGCEYHGWTDVGLAVTGTAANTRIIGGIALRCHLSGVFINTSGKGTLLDGVLAVNNNQSGLGGHGFDLDTGAQNVTLTSGCRAGLVTAIGGPSGVGSQQYGLRIAAGVHNVKVSDGNFTDNLTGAWNILSTEKTNIFHNNTTEHGVGDAVTAWRSTNQAVADATLVDVLCDTDLSDPNNMHDEVTPSASFFAWAPGFYTVTATIAFAANATGYRQVSLLRSDGVYFGTQQNTSPMAGAATVVNVTASVYLTAGQSVKVQVFQNSGGSLNITSVSQYAPSVSVVKQ